MYSTVGLRPYIAPFSLSIELSTVVDVSNELYGQARHEVACIMSAFKPPIVSWYSVSH